MKVRAAVTVALLAAGWFGFWYAYQAGREAGSAAVRADWSAAMVESEKAARKALLAAQAAYRADIARREGVERDLQEKLDAADRRGRDLARRLQGALAGLRMPRECPAAPVPDGPAGEPGDEGGIGAALADHLAACERDATRLAELQDWVR